MCWCSGCILGSDPVDSTFYLVFFLYTKPVCSAETGYLALIQCGFSWNSKITTYYKERPVFL